MENRISRGTRLFSLILDHVIMSVIALVISLPISIIVMSNESKPTHTYNDIVFMNGFLYALIFGINIYLMKDCFYGRSIGKRITQLQIVNIKNNYAATPFRCLIRNIFIVIWPIELIITIFSTERRLGDYFAGTKIVYYEKNKNSLKKTKLWKIIILYIIMVCISCVVKIPINGFLKNIDRQTKPFIVSSFNPNESQTLMNMLNDSLSAYISSDIKIYNNIEKSDKKYISAIIYVKVDYYNNKNQFKALDSAVLKIIANQLHAETYTGQIKYIYKDKFSSNIVIETIK